MEDNRALDLIRHHATLRTAAALTQTVADLVSTGQLTAGERLPTVRDTAVAVGMSRSAVGQAWQQLGVRGLVETRRRGGTRIIGKPRPPRAKRYESMILPAAADVRDLGNMDITGMTYPDLARAMSASLHQRSLHERFATPLTEELKAAVRPDWPFFTDSFLAAHGPMDGLELALSATVKSGDVVAVENPTSGRVFDMLDALGATPLPIEFETSGPSLADLQRALISKPAAFVYQPAGSAPSWRSVTARWIDEAATILPRTLPVIEYSQATALYPGGLSLGARLPRQVVHIRGYQLTLGQDMAVAVVGGNTEVLNAMWLRLTYSTRFVSRILQGTLAHLLTDKDSREQERRLVAEAHRRHRRFVGELRRHGFDVEDTSGPGVWLQVPDEDAVCARLSRFGILVHPGRLFVALPLREQRIHICSTAIVDDPDVVARLVAEACRRSPRPIL